MFVTLSLRQAAWECVISKPAGSAEELLLVARGPGRALRHERTLARPLKVVPRELASRHMPRPTAPPMRATMFLPFFWKPSSDLTIS